MRYDDVPKIGVWEQDSAAFASTNRVAAIGKAWGPQGAGAAASNLLGRAGLAPIDAEIKTYATAFSPMAKINVLTDLQRAITGWQQVHPGPLPAAMAALKEVVDRRLNLRPATSRYHKAICVAFHAGCNYDKATGTTHTSSTLNPDYFRHSSNDRLDMVAKCGDLWAGIQAAQSAIPLQGLADDNRTLKVFMAPEFFFRGKNGAYSPDIVSDIIPQMRTLGTSGGTFQDWLFIFGTAVAAFDDAVTYCSVCPYGTSTIKFERNLTAPNLADRAKTTPKCSVNPAHKVVTGTFGAEVQNVALIQHGGDDHMIAKEYVSGIDYKGNQVRIQPGKPDEATLKVRAPLGSTRNPGTMAVQSDERLGGCVFTVDGLTIGLEVCLDHSLAPKNAPEYGRASALASSIQILLIPSYGMSIGSGMHCRADGIAFNVDGRGTGNSQVKLNTGAQQPQNAKTVGQLALYGPFNIPG
jgi:hypothetical protein